MNLDKTTKNWVYFTIRDTGWLAVYYADDLPTDKDKQPESYPAESTFYVYMNYHPINDFPINLENVLKMMGFAHKKNAKRVDLPRIKRMLQNLFK